MVGLMLGVIIWLVVVGALFAIIRAAASQGWIDAGLAKIAQIVIGAFAIIWLLYLLVPMLGYHHPMLYNTP